MIKFWHFGPLGLALLIVAGVAFGGSMDQNGQTPTPPPLSAQMTRACFPAPGAPTAVSCTTSSASSSQLDPWTRYIMSCSADDAYVRFGATAPTAVATDIMLPRMAWFEFATTDTVRYVACKGATTTPSCVLLECK